MIKITEIINYSMSYPIENRYFTQFNVNSNYTLCPNFFNRYCIDSTTAKIQILSAKFIDTIKGESIEGQRLSGKKLSIIGVIYVKIIYLDIFTGKSYVINVPVTFSTFIIVPEKICSEDEINLGYLIEDLSIVKITKSKILISVTLLLQYENYH